MALNGAVFTADGQLVPVASKEVSHLRLEDVSFDIESGGGYPGNTGTYYCKKGYAVVSDWRIVFVADPPLEYFKSFSIPLHLLREQKLNQPLLGQSYFSAIVDPIPGGGLMGPGSLKMKFNSSADANKFHSIVSKMLDAGIYKSGDAFSHFDVPPPDYHGESSSSHGLPAYSA